jgi:hypothetical protein
LTFSWHDVLEQGILESQVADGRHEPAVAKRTLNKHQLTWDQGDQIGRIFA